MLEFPFKRLRIINYILIAFIFLTALLFARSIISLSFSKKEPPAVNTPVETANHLIPVLKNIMTYAPIVEKNPFGNPMKFQPASKVQGTDSRQGSHSELVLSGTVTGPRSLSYAIILDKSQPASRQEVFAYGEEVYGYGTLTKIEKEWIELTQGANTYTINLIDIKGINTNVSSPYYNSTSSSGFARKINEKQYLLDQRKVQQALDNPENILSDARLYPNIKNGRQEGFRIMEVKTKGIYESLGLRNRDILLRINGLELSSPEAAVQTMSALKGMNTVNLDIIRNGRKMTLDYQIR